MLVAAGGLAAIGGAAAFLLGGRRSAPAESTPPTAESRPTSVAQQTPSAIDPALAERALGRPDAPVTVIEYYSLTCIHCATFHRETLPRVKSELIEPGKVWMVFADFPLDQPGLLAAAVGRALPPDRHAAFIDLLFRTQAQWVRASYVEELAKLASVAGMSRETFDAVMRNEALHREVLQVRLRGEQQHQVTATPTFIFNNRVPGISGAIPFDRFAREAGFNV
jgi:protein-disulfide isomerase